MASYTLGVGNSTPEVDQQSWQMDGIFCPTCSLGAFRGTSRWTRTSETTTTRTFTYSCLRGHAWTREVPGNCPDRPADSTDNTVSAPPATDADPDVARV
jgi:hypothetical protein